LGSNAKVVIESERRQHGQVLVSAISAWEIGMLVRSGRLSLRMDVITWLDTVAEVGSFRFVPIDARIAARSVDLPGEFHKDPADRLIVATAREYSVPLVTADLKIRNYPHVETVW
jgi:PIN domain nuclease of toxin-antitoxin system